MAKKQKRNSEEENGIITAHAVTFNDPIEEPGDVNGNDGEDLPLETEDDDNLNTPDDDEVTSDGENTDEEIRLNEDEDECQCYPCGTTVKKYPALPEKDFIDYRAQNVIDCFEKNPFIQPLPEEKETELE